MKEKDALYAEAEAVYRRLADESFRLSRAGGAQEPTDVILETTTDAALDQVMEAVRGQAARGVRAEGRDPEIVVSRAPGVVRGDSAVALLVCIDARNWAFYRGNELVSEGTVIEDRMYFSSREGGLRISYVEGRSVDSCHTLAH